jgi:ribonuclease E
MAKQDMLINYVPGEECRIAITEDGRLEELYTERTSADLHVGNIYRGRVTNVEASIQAAFVDFGLERSGFLHITDLHPRYFPGKYQEDTERVGHKTPRRERPPMQQCLRRGQEIVVQVLKEGIGSKGPTVTSYLSIPGRFLVMMPWMERHGVSRKIDDPEKRKAMRAILDELDPPEDLGFIVRTAGFERTKTELKRDLNYLLRLWKDINGRMKVGRGPAELYTESDLIIRTLRDVVTTDVKRIIVDDRIAAVRSKQFLRIAMPRTTTKVIHHAGPVPLFDAFEIEQQIQQINERQVPLKCGGSLVFDSTEALVAIDVNSGKFRDAKDSEDSAYRTNLEAVEEIARQLRLRDLGGLLVLDLIDMYVHRHRREVERRFRDAMKKDRARSKVLKISDLGMLEMTRQRMRPSLKKSIYNECPTCAGSGQVLSAESVVLKVMRQLAVALSHDRVARSQLLASADVVTELSNRKRDALVNLERRSGKAILVDIDLAAGPDTVRLICFDAAGNKIEPDKLAKPKKPNFGAEDEISLEDVKDFERTQPTLLNEPDDTDESGQPAAAAEEGGEGGKKKRRRRRRRRRKPGGEEGGESEPQFQPSPEPAVKGSGYEGASVAPPADDSDDGPGNEPAAGEADGDGEGGDAPKKNRRRRRRGGRRHRKNKGESSDTADPSGEQIPGEIESEPPVEAAAEPADDQPPAPPKKKRRRRRRKSDDAPAAESAGETGESQPEAPSATEGDS